jgi:hypothetical protein
MPLHAAKDHMLQKCLKSSERITHLSEEPRLVAVFLVLNIEPGDPQEGCFECPPRPSSFLSSNES